MPAMCETKNDFKSDEKESLERILQEKLKWVSDAHQFAGNWDNSDRRLRKQLPEIRKAITQWQQAVVNHWEATGYRHNAQGASQLIEQRPVRVHVNSVFIADALDSADLACIMLHTTAQSSWSGISEAIKAPGDHQLTISRYTHKLPYALVKRATKAVLVQAHKRTKGRLLGEAMDQVWAKEVVQNLPVASKLDRYMQRKTKGKLQGSAIHNYRLNFKPTLDSYDHGNKDVHRRRLLLKAEPQSGKTGAYLGLLLQLKRLLQPGCGPGVAALPGIEHNARPDVVYGTPVAALRWKHPFFEDIRKSSFPEYGHVQPSKYAEKIVLQRAMLLAKCLARQTVGNWRSDYVKLMLSPEGEYTQTNAGTLLLNPVYSGPPAPPATWLPENQQLVIGNQEAFCKVYWYTAMLLQSKLVEQE